MCALDTGALPVDTLEDAVSYTSSVYNMHNPIKGKPKSKPVVPSTFGLGSFHSNIKNDGVTGEFDGNDYPHSREMLKVCMGSFYLWTSVRSHFFNNGDSNEILCLLLRVYEYILYIFYLKG